MAGREREGNGREIRRKQELWKVGGKVREKVGKMRGRERARMRVVKRKGVSLGIK